MPLSTPISARATDLAIQYAPAVEVNGTVQSFHEVDKGRIFLMLKDLVRYLERNRSRLGRVLGQLRFGEKNEVTTTGQSFKNLRGSLLPVKLSEEFFDELDLQSTLLQRVLFDVVLHAKGAIFFLRRFDT